MAAGQPSGLSESGRLLQVVIKHPSDAFGTAERAEAQWRDLNFSAAPDFARACDEYDRWIRLIASLGAELCQLPASGDTGLDSIYPRDASVVTPHGLVLCRMGKPQRTAEPPASGRAFHDWGIHVLGTIEAPGQLEGGDVVWLTPDVVAVGRGYRTNDHGIAQLREWLGPGIDCVTVPLPHWRGPGDVFHLMSIISPVAADLAVVYEPLLPVPFRDLLVSLGYSFVEVPHEEFDSMGANVLALAPRHCVMVSGNPRTRERLERAGATVFEYEGREISLKGGGGPTCLTRPILREARTPVRISC